MSLRVSAALALGLSGMRSCLALRRLLKLKWRLAHLDRPAGRQGDHGSGGLQVPRHATKESRWNLSPGWHCKAHELCGSQVGCFPLCKRQHESLLLWPTGWPGDWEGCWAPCLEAKSL